jgi:hypothetical protein
VTGKEPVTGNMLPVTGKCLLTGDSRLFVLVTSYFSRVVQYDPSSDRSFGSTIVCLSLVKKLD